MIMLAVAAFRLRSAGYALAVVAAGVIFPGTISLPWPGRHPVLPQQWQDDLYVLAGLAATAAGLALETLRPGRKSWAAQRALSQPEQLGGGLRAGPGRPVGGQVRDALRRTPQRQAHLYQHGVGPGGEQGGDQ